LFNKDYIMRMIEMLVQGIAKIMRLKQEKKYEECGAVLTDTLRQFYGLNDRSVENLPWTDLMAVANLGGLPDAEKCALLAQLIREKAELEELNGRKDVSVSLYFKALCIYASAVLADNDFNIPVHRENIDGIAAIAGKYALPADALRLLVQYYELTGRYAKAEDALYRLLERREGRGETTELGRAFYRRLLEKSDTELAGGNLPRDEVLEGLAKLM
jgi:tetratricopeptide (TPR) repeat protein